MRYVKRTCWLCLLLCVMLMFSACGVKVSFEIGDAALVSGKTVQVYKEDRPVTAPVVEKEGYVLEGWDGDFSAPTEDMTVRPIWKKVHIVTFDLTGGTAFGAELVQKIEDGNAATAPNVEREGYAFDGWDSDFSKPSADLTVKAKWKKLHTVIFDPAGGIAAPGVALIQKVKDGESASAPTLSREGYAFDGWSGDFSVLTADVTVTAKWKKIHTVTFDPNGGQTVSGASVVQAVVDGEAVQAPVVTKEKYNFVGWDADLSAVTGDMTVKAIWERKSFTATEMFALVSPATVEIKTYRQHRVFFSLGSGFFIDEDGLLLTNYHVIENGRSYYVYLSDGKQYAVTSVVGYDIQKDIAILRVDTRGNKVPYLEIGDDAPKVGDAVYAVGSPLGLTGTFSSGIVSAVNREINGVRFIQTSTPISQGNSGGPLVNEKGYVIGINSASFTDGQNLNLAVEISQYLTVRTVDMTPEELFQKEGTLESYFGETEVSENSMYSSEKGQILQSGDTIRSVIQSETETDYYMLEAPEEEAVLLLMVETKDEERLQELAYYGMIFYTETESAQDGYTYPEEYTFAQIVDDGEGSVYLVVSVAIPRDYVSQMKYIGVMFMAESRLQYDLYMYMMTDLDSFM